MPIKWKSNLRKICIRENNNIIFILRLRAGLNFGPAWILRASRNSFSTWIFLSDNKCTVPIHCTISIVERSISIQCTISTHCIEIERSISIQCALVHFFFANPARNATTTNARNATVLIHSSRVAASIGRNLREVSQWHAAPNRLNPIVRIRRWR